MMWCGRGDLRFPKDMYTNTEDYTHSRRIIRALLEPNVGKRLGCLKRGALDIKEAPFFEEVRRRTCLAARACFHCLG